MRYRIGMIIEGRITGIQPYGAFVSLDNRTQGLIHISECHHGYVDNIRNFLKVGQMVRVMIIDIDEYTGKISLSIRCLEKAFDFSREKRRPGFNHRKYWTNKHVQEGFKPISKRMSKWINEALEGPARLPEEIRQAHCGPPLRLQHPGKQDLAWTLHLRESPRDGIN